MKYQKGDVVYSHKDKVKFIINGWTKWVYETSDNHTETILKYVGTLFISDKEWGGYEYHTKVIDETFTTQPLMLYTVANCPHEKTVDVGFHFTKKHCLICCKDLNEG